jgi:adenosylcobinamide-phosphate synthase
MEILLLAVALDLLIGDPQVPFHPVALVGKLIAGWDKLLNRPESPGRQRVAGALMVIVTVLGLTALIYLLLDYLIRMRLFYTVVGALLLWSIISVRSLDQAARGILKLLQDHDLKKARLQLAMIVGRDTDDLDEGEIARATVETVAENISDGTIAPLFYYLIGGVPLACAYRIVNTFDSMVGYKSERYLYFGWFAAKLDDMANYLPSRLTALLLVAGAWLTGFDWRRAWMVMRRDRKRHPSPNSGYPEAAVAGALGVQLGGTNYYQGVVSRRPLMGDATKKLAADEIADVIRVIYGALAVFLAVYGITVTLWLWYLHKI